MYREGRVAELDYERGRARVRFDEDDLTSPWLAVLQRNAAPGGNRDQAWPEVDEIVAVVLDEHGDKGVVLGAIYSEQHKPAGASADVRRVTFGDDGAVQYDRAQHRLTADVQEFHVGAGASKLTREDRVVAALNALKSAIQGGVPIAMDGGVGLQTTILAALADWPPAMGSDRSSSD